MVIPSERMLPSDPELHLLPSPSDPAITDVIFAKESHANTLPYPPETPFDFARRKFMLAHVARFPQEVREAWEKGELTQNPTTHNIIEHMVASSIIAGIIAREAGYPEIARQVEYASLLHDTERLKEKDLLEKAIAKKKWPVRRLTVEKALASNRRLLEPLGIDGDIIQLTDAVVADDATTIPSDPRRQIMHLVDAMMNGSRIQDPQTRMNSGASTEGNRNNETVKVRDRYHAEMLGVSDYRETQVKIAHQEAEVLCAKIRAEGIHGDVTPENLPLFLQQRFDEEVMSFAQKNNLPF